DVFSGTLYFTQFQGQADLELMNLLGYDAMGLGNHEFDKGPEGSRRAGTSPSCIPTTPMHIWITLHTVQRQ
ncbi:MAG: hypothetical protein M1489_07390, partial [Firmicutes bacterium]|nr:hypothetical protein [Bacillota bacterium]